MAGWTGLNREDSRCGLEIFDNRIKMNVSPVGAAGFSVFGGFPGNRRPAGWGFTFAIGRAL
jgi:hypothetical protein